MTDVRWTMDIFHRIEIERDNLDAGDVLEPNRWAQRRERRKATRAEVAEGTPVDAQGRLIPVIFRGTAEDLRKQFESVSKVHRLSA